MNKSHQPTPNDMALELLDGSPHGIALSDDKGDLLYSNSLFNCLNLPSCKQLLEQSIDLAVVSFDQKISNKLIRIEITRLTQGYAIVAKDIENRACAREKTLAALVTVEKDNIYDVVVKNIYETTGWRWVAVSRFIDNQAIEILSIYEHGKKIESYVYDILGTPCEVVAFTKEFAYFPKLHERFPHYQALHKMGAQVYAGMVYRSEQLAIGHIFAMHDKVDINVPLIEDVIRLSTSILSYKLEVQYAQITAQNAETEANLDALTQIFNRRAFDRDVATCVGYMQKSTFSETLLVVIDLDGMKQINDTLGHIAGDRLLKVFTESLSTCSRPEDKLYRLGGDEFAMILNGASLDQIDVISQRINKAIKKTQQAGFASIGVSMGFAALSENANDVQVWFRCADERMYQHKQAKK